MAVTKEQYQELQNKIRANDHAYYIKDDPIITDHEYDLLFQQLLAIELDYPSWISSESPSQRVGIKPQADFSTFEHHKPMLSLANAFNDQDILGFHERTIKNLQDTKELQYFTIKKCNSLSGNCNPVGAAVNYFCFLPDGSSPQNIKATIEAAGNAGDKSEFIHFYKSGFFNNGERM